MALDKLIPFAGAALSAATITEWDEVHAITPIPAEWWNRKLATRAGLRVR